MPETHIGRSNAKSLRETLRGQIAADFKSHVGSVLDEGDEDVEELEMAPPAGEPQTTEQPKADEPTSQEPPIPETQASTEVPVAYSEDAFKALQADHAALKAELDPLKKKYEILDRNFRAIQATTTPTQQERNALREKVKKLEAELAAYRPTDGGVADLADKLKAAEDSLKGEPELLAALKATAAVAQGVNELKADQVAAQARNLAQVKADVTKAVFAAHPDASAFGDDPAFWKWVDAQPGGVPSAYHQILAEPWNHDPQHTIDILSMYKDERGSAPVPQAPPATPVPPPAARPATPRPTDIAAPSGGTPTSVSPSSTQGTTGRWTDAQWAAANKKLRTGTPAQILELRKQMKAQLTM